MKVLVASTNAKKLGELVELVQGLSLQIVSPADLGKEIPEVEETGSTFEANARLKALAYAAWSGLPTVADDSGLSVDVLRGEPGVFSARYSGIEKVPDRDQRNLDKLLLELRDVPSARRSAAYHCSLCLALPDGTEHCVEGMWKGQIAFSPRGSGGFGYDPIFLLPERGQTAAELSKEQKQALSHRGRAMRALRPMLERLASFG